MSMLQFDEDAARTHPARLLDAGRRAATRRGSRAPRRPTRRARARHRFRARLPRGLLGRCRRTQRRCPRARPEHADERRRPRSGRRPAVGQHRQRRCPRAAVPRRRLRRRGLDTGLRVRRRHPSALTELRRVLRTGGRALLLDTDWDSVVWHAADRERHQRIMAAWEEHLVDPHLPATLPGQLRRAGFRVTGRSPDPPVQPDLRAEHLQRTDHGVDRAVRQRTPGSDPSGRRRLDGRPADRGAEDDYLFSVNRYCFLAVAE